MKLPVFLIVCATSSAAGAQTLWTQHQGNAAHTGFVPVALGPAHMAPLWQQTPTDPVHFHQLDRRSVAIDGQYVFATLGEGDTDNYRVYAFDRATGAPAWYTPITSSTYGGVSPPSVLGDAVFVHRYGHSGSTSRTPPALVRLDRATGAVLSTATHPGQSESGSRPVPLDGAVFAAGGYYGGFDAYRASTGAKTWSNEYASGNYTAAPAADDRYVYAFSRYGSYESRLVAADRATGQVAFTILYDRADGNAYPAHLMSPALDGRGRAFVIGTDRVGFSTSNALHAFDLDGRRVAWSTRGGFSGYLAFNADLIAAPELDQLTFIDHATGTRLWSWDGDSNILGNAVLTDHHALVSTLTATYAIDLDSHQVAWSAPVGGMLALTDDLLVISSRTGVYAYSVPEPSALPAAALAAFATRRTRRTPRTPR